MRWWLKIFYGDLVIRTTDVDELAGQVDAYV